MTEPKIQIYENAEKVVEALAEDFFQFCGKKEKAGEKISLALSGGSTPKALFQYLAENFEQKINWKNIHFFWVDERCVKPDDPESNYGAAKHLLLDPVAVPAENVHRMKGESDPEQEAIRYETEVLSAVSLKYNLPRFDWIWLGMGEDGHTASVFPDQLALMHSERICETAVHPVTKQKRITLTGKALNHARRATFLVTGKSKAEMARLVLKEPELRHKYPASHIRLSEGELEWYLDKAAAGLL